MYEVFIQISSPLSDNSGLRYNPELVLCHLEGQSVAGEPDVGKVSRRERRERRDQNEKLRHVVVYLNHDGTLAGRNRS
jgi:hypothetical protein